jgi:hypothetical protein
MGYGTLSVLNSWQRLTRIVAPSKSILDLLKRTSSSQVVSFSMNEAGRTLGVEPSDSSMRWIPCPEKCVGQSLLSLDTTALFWIGLTPRLGATWQPHWLPISAERSSLRR